MNNFDYYNPTHIIFGQGRISDIGQHIPLDAKILITYGGGSAKKFGTIDEVKAALGQRDVMEFGGIEANPSYETLMQAVEVVKENKIDYLLAVGGGSVIDGTKFIAAATFFTEDPWEIWRNRKPINKALPYGCVLTLPATGSEMNNNSVVSHKGLKEKTSHRSPLLFPQFAVLDPTKTYTLPKRQVANGVVDAFVHVIEQYLTYPVYAQVQDRYAESLLITLIEEGPKGLTHPEDYLIRANIMWAATQALNGLIGAGVPQDWVSHRIGHQFTALYNIDHGASLAITLPGVMHIQRESKKEKLLQYAARVWGITEGDEQQRIDQVIEKTVEFFEFMGVKTRISDYDLYGDTTERAIDKVVENMEKFKQLPQGEHLDVDADKVRQILTVTK